MKPGTLHHGSSRRRLLPLLAVSVVLSISACTPTNTFIRAATGEHAWPAPPESPRLRYVGEISGKLTGLNDRSKFQQILFGPLPERSLVTPSTVAVDASGNHVAIADPNAHCVHVLNILSNKSVSIDAAGDNLLDAPIGVAWGEDFLFVSDPPRKVVEVFRIRDTRIEHLRTIAGAFERPTGLAYDEQFRLVYACDSAKHAVQVLDTQGSLIRTLGGPGTGPGQFRFPVHVACGNDGVVVVSDSMNFRVQRFARDGQFIKSFGQKGDAAGDLALPKGVAVDVQGNVWVVDAQFENMQAFSPEGELLLALGGEGHGPGEFWLPAGAFIDRQQRLWVADTYNRRVQIFQLMP